MGSFPKERLFLSNTNLSSSHFFEFQSIPKLLLFSLDDTFLGNRSLNIYCQFGTVYDALKVFDDIAQKNCISCKRKACWAWLLRERLVGLGLYDKPNIVTGANVHVNVHTWIYIVINLSLFNYLIYYYCENDFVFIFV